MDNFLKGVQYREQLTELPSWRVEQRYGPWMDITDPNQVFTTGTQFRPKPKFKYKVTIGVVYYGDLTLDAAMAKVAGAAKEGLSATLQAGDIVTTTSIRGRKIQYRLLGSANKWETMENLVSGVRFSHAVKFRVRPDFYFLVNAIHCDDEEDLKAVISTQLAAGEFNFTVKKVMYE